MLRSVPHFLSGAFRAAYRVALSETVPGCEEREGTRQIRSLEVVHACAEDVVAPPSMRRFGQIGRAVRHFADGQWVDVVNESSLDAGRALLSRPVGEDSESVRMIWTGGHQPYIWCIWARCP